MKFRLEDKVRVVSADSHFFGFEGEVVGCYDGDFMAGVKHYHVKFNYPTLNGMPPFLFKERELSYAG